MNRSFFLTIIACCIVRFTFADNPSAVWTPDNGDGSYNNPIFLPIIPIPTYAGLEKIIT